MLFGGNGGLKNKIINVRERERKRIAISRKKRADQFYKQIFSNGWL